jgi:hypothetical protein
MSNGRTRLRLTLFGCGLIFIEAMIRTFIPAFPFLESVSPEVALIVAYISGKTVQEVQDSKYGSTNNVEK